MVHQSMIFKRRSALTMAQMAAVIRQLELYTTRLLRGTHLGDFSSAIKGSGFEFDQLRDYQEGDDVRFIDWKSSTRVNRLMVRQYLEDRNRSMVIMVDVSASMWCGSGTYLKGDIAATLASVLALLAEYGKDGVGLLLFSDRVHTYIPPARGRKHMHALIAAIYAVEITQGATDMNVALAFVAQQKIRDLFLFVLSDFIATDFERALRSVTQRCEVVAIRCLDHFEQESLPPLIVTLHDPECGVQQVVALRGQDVCDMRGWLRARLETQSGILRRQQVPLLDVSTQQCDVRDVIMLFRRIVAY